MFKEEDPVIIKLSKRKAVVIDVGENHFDKSIFVTIELQEGPWKGETMRMDPEKLKAA